MLLRSEVDLSLSWQECVRGFMDVMVHGCDGSWMGRLMI